jgi:translation initiation factor 4E
MALVGEQIDERDEICGAGTIQSFDVYFHLSRTVCSFPTHTVVSVRHKIDRIQVWTRSKDNVDLLNSIGKKLYKLLDLSNEPSIGLEFQVRREL